MKLSKRTWAILAGIAALTVAAGTAPPSWTSIILTPGSAPGSPTNGQLWTTAAGLFARINGSTVGPMSAGGGSLELTDGTTDLTGVTKITTPLCSLTVGGTAGASTLTPTVCDTTTAGSISSWNIGGQNTMSSSGTATLPTLTAGQSFMLVTGSGATATLTKPGGVTLAGAVASQSTLAPLNFLSCVYNSATVYDCATGGVVLTNATGLPVSTGLTGAGTGVLTALGNAVNTSGGVSTGAATLTANLPVIGGGSGTGLNVGTRSGNTTAFVTTTGAQTSGKCVTIDANGNHVADSAACGGGGGSGAVTLVSTQTANNSATTLSWTGLAGNEYQLRCSSLLGASGSPSLGIQFGTGGGPTYATSGYTNTAATFNSTQTIYAGGTSQSALFSGSMATSGNIGLSLVADMHDLASTTVNKTLDVVGGSILLSGTFYRITGTGYYTSNTTAITAIRVIELNGSNLLSGTCSLYAISS